MSKNHPGMNAAGGNPLNFVICCRETSLYPVQMNCFQQVDDVELAKSKPEMAVDCTEPPYDPPPYVAIDNSGIEDQKAATGDKTWSGKHHGFKYSNTG